MADDEYNENDHIISLRDSIILSNQDRSLKELGEMVGSTKHYVSTRENYYRQNWLRRFANTYRWLKKVGLLDENDNPVMPPRKQGPKIGWREELAKK